MQQAMPNDANRNWTADRVIVTVYMPKQAGAQWKRCGIYWRIEIDAVQRNIARDWSQRRYRLGAYMSDPLMARYGTIAGVKFGIRSLIPWG